MPANTSPEDYLQFSDDEITQLNPKGLGKLLFIRKETRYLKNIMRQATADRELAEALFADVEIAWPDYLRLLSKRLRRVLKAERVIANFHTQQQLAHFQSGDTLHFLNDCPLPFLAAFDFDRTLTNRKFIPQVRELLQQHQGTGQFWVCSAHGRADVIQQFLNKHELPIRQSRIRAMGSVTDKKKLLFQLALSTDRFVMVYFDDERTMCDTAVLLGYHAYLVQKEAEPVYKPVGFQSEKVK